MLNHFLACVPSDFVMGLEASDDIVYQCLEFSFVIFSVFIGFQTSNEVIAHDSKLVCFVHLPRILPMVSTQMITILIR